MGTVVVSYRHADAAGQAARIASALRRCFTGWQVFFDADAFTPGRDFPAELEATLMKASALVAVIGRNWLACTDDAGKQRLADPDDWVRKEIALALDRNILVVPVYLDGARQLRTDELPRDIQQLAIKTSVDIRPATWSHDTKLVVRAVRTVMPLNCLSIAGVGVALAILIAGALVYREYFPPEKYILEKVSGDGVVIPNLGWNDKEKFTVRVRDLAGSPIFGARVAWRTEFCPDRLYVTSSGKDGIATATNVCSASRPLGTYWQRATPVADDTRVGEHFNERLREVGRQVSFTFQTPQ